MFVRILHIYTQMLNMSTYRMIAHLGVERCDTVSQSNIDEAHVKNTQLNTHEIKSNLAVDVYF